MDPSPTSSPAARRAFTLHDRLWKQNRYVYPVVSRRSKGLSIGVNLNPDKVCNFDCIYCSVDRTTAPLTTSVDLPLLRSELAHMIALARSGDIFKIDPFNSIPPTLQRINDIAFSGDGEPTTFPEFPEACRIAAELKSAAAVDSVKLVLITNATMFHRPAVAAALTFLDQHNGEIWAKLDAGTDAYYHLIDRTTIPFQRVLDNILACAKIRPTVIQSLLMRVHNIPPSANEISALASRLSHILTSAGRLKLLQLYTVARTTTEPYATPLTAEELTTIATQINTAIPSLPIETYP